MSNNHLPEHEQSHADLDRDAGGVNKGTLLLGVLGGAGLATGTWMGTTIADKQDRNAGEEFGRVAASYGSLPVLTPEELQAAHDTVIEIDLDEPIPTGVTAQDDTIVGDPDSEKAKRHVTELALPVIHFIGELSFHGGETPVSVRAVAENADGGFVYGDEELSFTGDLSGQNLLIDFGGVPDTVTLIDPGTNTAYSIDDYKVAEAIGNGDVSVDGEVVTPSGKSVTDAPTFVDEAHEDAGAAAAEALLDDLTLIKVSKVVGDDRGNTLATLKDGSPVVGQGAEGEVLVNHGAASVATSQR